MATLLRLKTTTRVDEEVDEIVGRGPSGAFAVAGVATAIVVAIYFAFYFFVYLPRGAGTVNAVTPTAVPGHGPSFGKRRRFGGAPLGPSSLASSSPSWSR
jgi:hypothetical protein